MRDGQEHVVNVKVLSAGTHSGLSHDIINLQMNAMQHAYSWFHTYEILAEAIAIWATDDECNGT